MADTFRDREKGYETKFKLDEEYRFKAEARRNKMIGLWAAGKMGMSFSEADAYAKTVVAADFDEPGSEDVVRKVMADLNAKKAGVTEDDLRSEMVRLYGEALSTISEESK
jgi:hypothetical protein